MSARTLSEPTQARPIHFTALSLAPAQQALSRLLAFPFDAVRAQYGTAVELGLVQRSILASRRLERCLDRLERLSLGPLARRV
jgi:hypothetical protein